MNQTSLIHTWLKDSQKKAILQTLAFRTVGCSMLIQQAPEHLLIHFVEMTVAQWCSHTFSDSGISDLYFYEEEAR